MMLAEVPGMTVVLEIAMGMLSLSLILTLGRLIRGPSLPDRVVALDQFANLVVGIIVVQTIESERTEILRAAIILALISFLGTIAFARYAEKRGKP